MLYSGLDLSDYVIDEDHEKPVYDLFAVSNCLNGGNHCEIMIVLDVLIVLSPHFQILLIVRTSLIISGTYLMIVMFLKQIHTQFV